MECRFVNVRKNQSKRLTIYDIASEVGVSRSTVSRVLNSRDDVSQETRARVLHALRRHGFVRNIAAAQLAGVKPTAIGFLIPSVRSGWSAQIVMGVGEAATRHGRQLLLATTRFDSVHADEENWLQILRSGLVTGVIMVLSSSSPERLFEVAGSELPLVLVDYQGHDMPYPRVEAANYEGARSAVDHLLELGHKRIAVITGPLRFGCSNERLRGYGDSLRVASIAYDASLVVEGDFSEESGERATERLLRMEKPPTALFCSNDLMAFGALKVLKKAGIRVPRDISVVGFDDQPGTERTDPALTTVRQPLYEMGKAAFELLLDQLETGEAKSEAHTLPTRLIVRQSTGPPPASERRE